MTDLQVKAQANEIAEEKNAIERSKVEETVRANKMKEMLTDLENLAKYGYTSYAPGTDEGYITKSGVYGVSNAPFDFWNKSIGSLIGPIAKIFGGK